MCIIIIIIYYIIIIIIFFSVEQVVIDEADKLFEAGNCGFSKQLRQILDACTNENRKIAMFGATSRPAVTKWCFKNVKNLTQVNIGRR